MDELIWPYLDIGEAAEGLQRREFSATELVQAHVARIATLDGTLKAFVWDMSEQAFEAARDVDNARAAGDQIPTLSGIPIAIKDNFETAGIRTTAGSPGLSDHIPSRDAVTIARLREAGAAFVGKVNLDELAFGGESKNEVGGATLNPWDGVSIPGGSSGGSGAAVAASMCMGATGSDTGGSIRNPSAWCGVAGVKPTYGSIDPAGVVPLAWSMDTVGFLARTVSDLAILLSETIDSLGGQSRNSRRSYVSGALSSPGPIRVGLISNAVDLSEAGARDAYLAALSQLEDVVAIDQASLTGLDDVVLATITILLSEGAAAWEPYVREGWSKFGAPVRSMIDVGRLVRAVDYLNALRIRESLKRQVERLFENFDFLMMPAMGIDPRPDVFAGDTAVGPGSLMWELEAKFTSAWNLTGLPVVSLPVGFTKSGWPIVSQIIGPAGADNKVLQVGATIEQSLALPRASLVPTWCASTIRSTEAGD